MLPVLAALGSETSSGAGAADGVAGGFPHLPQNPHTRDKVQKPIHRVHLDESTVVQPNSPPETVKKSKASQQRQK